MKKRTTDYTDGTDRRRRHACIRAISEIRGQFLGLREKPRQFSGDLRCQSPCIKAAEAVSKWL